MTSSEFLGRSLERELGSAARGLRPLGLHTVEDLLRYFPRRYDDPRALTWIGAFVEGLQATVIARVLSASKRRMRGRPGWIIEAKVTDDTDVLTLTFFAKRDQVATYTVDRLKVGAVGIFAGEVSRYQGRLQLTHPDFEMIGPDVTDRADAAADAARPIPIYPATKQVRSWRIQQAVAVLLDSLAAAEPGDPIPAQIRASAGLPDMARAYRMIHRPDNQAEWVRAQQRFRFEEAFLLQVSLVRRRAAQAAIAGIGRPARAGGLLEAFDAALPFALTPSQVRVGRELSDCLGQAQPMHRLLQGDVGSGKTIVALRAMLQVVDAGGQAALLVPTEVLAGQHMRSLRSLLGPLAEEGLLADDGLLPDDAGSVRLRLLTGSQSTAERRRGLDDIASGQADIAVGTHALLSDPVAFADLGLVVVDEQHRFGVEQRDLLRSRASRPPHVLVMTATPIPRTVAMTVFGDLDVSQLTELPAGRASVTTHWVPGDKAAWLERTWTRLAEEVAAGHRGYVVCPRISAHLDEEGELTASTRQPELDHPTLQPEDRDSAEEPHLLATVEDTLTQLRANPALAGVRLAALHGKMAPEDKERTMVDFAAGDIDVLVATTVIQVGIDVPEATAMIILDADRFGLSELHQLRGRVGRGGAPAVCLLVSRALTDSVAGQRIAAMVATTDGFALARKDLEIRREGDILGANQSGFGRTLRLLSVLHDEDIIDQARQLAVAIIEGDPNLDHHVDLRDAIERRLSEREEYLDRD